MPFEQVPQSILHAVVLQTDPLRDYMAARQVASRAVDADDCWMLLSILGLDLESIRAGKELAETVGGKGA